MSSQKTLKVNSSPQKNDVWKMKLSFWDGSFYKASFVYCEKFLEVQHQNPREGGLDLSSKVLPFPFALSPTSRTFDASGKVKEPIGGLEKDLSNASWANGHASRNRIPPDIRPFKGQHDLCCFLCFGAVPLHLPSCGCQVSHEKTLLLSIILVV